MIAGIHNGVKWAYNLCKDAIAINAFVVEFVDASTHERCAPRLGRHTRKPSECESGIFQNAVVRVQYGSFISRYEQQGYHAI
jgi:hypothetical protein